MLAKLELPIFTKFPMKLNDFTMPLGEMDDSQKQQMTQLYGEMEVSVSVTFPGRVTEERRRSSILRRR